jgi:hypothetical protein
LPRREWIRKNRYCRNARLDEKSFEMLVFLWFSEFSARSAARVMASMAQIGIVQPADAKTIASYMQRFGFVLSGLTLERDLLREHPGFEIIRAEDHALFIETVEMRAKATVEHALGTHSYRVYQALYGKVSSLETTGELALEIRRMNALRRGIKPPYRGDVAMALYRLSTREAIGGEASADDFRRAMANSFLEELARHPMDIGRR